MFSVKKIGESCGGSNEHCVHPSYCSRHSHTCICAGGKLASKNKIFCGRMYGEECRTGSAECNQDMPCIDGKCVCKSGYKNYNYTPQYTHGFMRSKCIPNDTIPNQKAYHPCYLDGLCESGLVCTRCLGSTRERCLSGPKLWNSSSTVNLTESIPSTTVTPTVSSSSTTAKSTVSSPSSTVKPIDSTGSSGSNSTGVDIGLKGTNQLSVGLVALGGLLVTAVLTKFY
ncbi:hypothetical protein LSAT2_016428 [Lamellibrachia satsuma]|nr:hypothetical protein LSAT2_016428 [Lamellibrachia satsuma]